MCATLILSTGCSSEAVFGVDAERTAAPYSNKVDFLIGNFNIKKVENNGKDVLPEFDFTGPKNYGVQTNTPSETITDNVSSQEKVSKTIYLVPAHMAGLAKIYLPLSKQDRTELINYLLLDTRPDSITFKKGSSFSETEKSLRQEMAKFTEYYDKKSNNLPVNSNYSSEEVKYYNKLISKFLSKSSHKLSLQGGEGSSSGDKYEYDYTWTIANKIQKILVDKGFNVIISRSAATTTDGDFYGMECSNAAKEENADLCISIHFSHKSSQDMAVLIPSTNYVTNGIATYSKGIAKKINDEIHSEVEEWELDSLLNSAEIPSVLVRLGQIDKFTKKGIEEISEAIAQGIINYTR